MSKLDFDPIDAALTVGLAMSGFIMTGIATFSLFDVNFGDTIYTLASYDISYAYGLSVVAIGGTIVTNDNTELSTLQDDIEDLDDYYKYAVVGTLGLLVAWLVIPSVQEFFTSSDVMGIVYVGLTTTGQFVLGWML